MSLGSNFDVKKLSIADVDEILNFIDVYYSQDNEKHIFGEMPDLDKYNATRVRLKLDQDWSYGVYEKSSQMLVGVMLGGVQKNKLDPSGTDLENEGLRLNSKLQAMRNFFAKLEENVFAFVNVEKVFYPGMITVHSQYRSQGIASFFLEFSQKVAIEAGCKFVIATPTNELLCSSLTRRGWTVFREFGYKEYDRENGTTLYSSAVYPFTKAQLVYKQVDQYKLFLLKNKQECGK